MSYVLDGIPTAMVRTEVEDPHEGGRQRAFKCPCGFVAQATGGGIDYRPVTLDTLRFHYTHCPKAKAPPLTPEQQKELRSFAKYLRSGNGVEPGPYMEEAALIEVLLKHLTP